MPMICRIPVNGLHANQVDNSLEIFFGSNWQLNGHGTCAQTFPYLLDHAHEIGTGAIHLVDESHARHVVRVA